MGGDHLFAVFSPARSTNNVPIRAKSTKPSGRIAFALRERFIKSSGTGIDWFAKNRRLTVLGIVVLPEKT